MSLPRLNVAAVIALALVVAGGGPTLPAQPGRGPREEGPAPPPAPRPDASRVMFLSRRSGENLLYRMRPDGTDIEPFFGGKVRAEDLPVVTPGVALHRDPHWSRLSPDRTLFLSWVRDVECPGPGLRSRFMLYAGRVADGRALVVAPDCRDELFAWAPDSRRFAYAEQSGRPGRVAEPGDEDITSRVFTVNADGTGAEMVLERKGSWSVRDWSGDGKRLLLGMRKADAPLQEVESRLFELELSEVLKAGKWNDDALTELMPPAAGADEAGGRGRAASPGEIPPGAIRWFGGSARYAPDGKRVAMVVWRPKDRVDLATFDDAPVEKRLARFDRETTLAVFDVGTRKLKTVAQYPDGLRGPICWSPDGTEVLFSRRLKAEDRREKTDPGERGLGIWAVRADGTGERFLTTGWCPDWR